MRSGTNVFLWRNGGYERVGFLLLEEDGKRILRSQFQYAAEYVSRKAPSLIPVDPASLPLSLGTRIEENAFERPLFGVFADCCPDTWGRRILYEIATEKRIEVTYLDWITSAGPGRIGALAFGKDKQGPCWDSPLQLAMAQRVEGNLADMVLAAEMFQQKGFHEMPAHLRNYLMTAPSVGGSRPKALLNCSGQQVIAKFKAPGDIWNVCRIEYATMTFAEVMGIDVPKTWIKDINGRDVFLIERFDRTDAGLVHVVTASAMVQEKTEGPKLKDQRSYSDIADAISRFGPPKHVRLDQRELYKRMVYNILMNNEDDHLRNHSFFFDGIGWRLTKLYDVVPMEHRVAHLWLEAGKRATEMSLSNALTGHAAFGLTLLQAREVIEQMTDIFFSRWEKHFTEKGVVADDLGKLRHVLGPMVRAELETDDWVRRTCLRPLSPGA